MRHNTPASRTHEEQGKAQGGRGTVAPNVRRAGTCFHNSIAQVEATRALGNALF